MSTIVDLDKGMSQSKRKNKTPGESSQQAPKKSRTAEPSTPTQETSSAVPDVEVFEAPRRVSSPPVQISEEQGVGAQDEPLPVEEPVVEDIAQVFGSVI